MTDALAALLCHMTVFCLICKDELEPSNMPQMTTAPFNKNCEHAVHHKFSFEIREA